MKYNLSTFIEKLNEKYENEPFEILEYNGISKEGKYYCGLCKKEYKLYKMGNLLSEKRKHLCTHCFASSYTSTVLDMISTNENFSFKQLGYNYTSHKPTVIYECKNCNQENEKPLVEFIKYPTCIHCGKNAKRRTDKTIESLLPDEFELIGEYKNQYEKTLFRHNCGFIFKMRPKDLLTNHSYCPKCTKKSSKGERKIMSFCDANNITFIKEKTFPWSDKKRYDFYLPDYNLLIEYHGIQHYKEVDNFFLSLEEQQKIDCFKKQAALENKYDFLEIPYYDYENIEKILVQRLSLTGVEV